MTELNINYASVRNVAEVFHQIADHCEDASDDVEVSHNRLSDAVRDDRAETVLGYYRFAIEVLRGIGTTAYAYEDKLNRFCDGHTNSAVAGGYGSIDQSNSARIVGRLDYHKVDRVPISMHATQPSTESIIKEIGGGDLTDGSCSSVALAYIANKNGMDVHDFRGGDSRRMFSMNENIELIAEMGDGDVIRGKNDYKALKQLLPKMEAGKEYYLATGAHASIVRKTESGRYEYLELQSPDSCGFKTLHGRDFKTRFGCSKGRTENTNVLISADKLAQNSSFGRMMEYINTPKQFQVMGNHGRRR